MYRLELSQNTRTVPRAFSEFFRAKDVKGTAGIFDVGEDSCAVSGHLNMIYLQEPAVTVPTGINHRATTAVRPCHVFRSLSLPLTLPSPTLYVTLMSGHSLFLERAVKVRPGQAHCRLHRKISPRTCNVPTNSHFPSCIIQPHFPCKHHLGQLCSVHPSRIQTDLLFVSVMYRHRAFVVE